MWGEICTFPLLSIYDKCDLGDTPQTHDFQQITTQKIKLPHCTALWYKKNCIFANRKKRYTHEYTYSEILMVIVADSTLQKPT